MITMDMYIQKYHCCTPLVKFHSCHTNLAVNSITDYFGWRPNEASAQDPFFFKLLLLLLLPTYAALKFSVFFQR